MANVPQAAQPTISAAPTAAYRVSRTVPDELLRHDISDEELDVLVDVRRDYLWEGMWAAGGIAAGSGKSAIESLYAAYGASPATPLTAGAQFEVTVFFVALASFGLLAYMLKNKSKVATALARTIRERTKHRVSG